MRLMELCACHQWLRLFRVVPPVVSESAKDHPGALHDRASLERQSKKQLQDICTALGQIRSGNKPHLVDRIIQAQAASAKASIPCASGSALDTAQASTSQVVALSLWIYIYYGAAITGGRALTQPLQLRSSTPRLNSALLNL